MVFDRTTFSIDLIGRYVCNTWDEAINLGGPSYDVVVIGAGMFGGYCAEKIYRFAKEAGKTPRILVLDAGSLLLTQHEQNYPRISPNTGPSSLSARTPKTRARRRLFGVIRVAEQRVVSCPSDNHR